MLAATVGLALAQPLLLNAYTTLAAKWFPLDQRAMVSGLAMAANFIGTTVGLVLTPALTTRYLYCINAIHLRRGRRGLGRGLPGPGPGSDGLMLLAGVLIALMKESNPGCEATG